MNQALKTVIFAIFVFVVYAADASASNWRFERWRRNYPHYARGEAYGEDYSDVKLTATRRGEQRCNDVGGSPYGENFELCQDEGRVSISIHCYIYVPCQQ